MPAEDLTVDTVLLERVRSEVVLLTLNRPERRNAMSAQLVTDLHAALDAVAADPTCRVAIVTGAGAGFCAGLDLAGIGVTPGTEGLDSSHAAMRTQQHIATLVPHLRGLRKPVIAAVNGAAAGGGLALALGCDIRVCSESARFNVAFVRVGLSGCDIGVSWLLPRLVGASRAFELMLTGRFVDATEAERIGLVSRVVPDGEVVDAALAIADQIAANAPFGVWMTKEVMWSQLEIGSLTAGIDLENRTQLLASHSGDLQEAIAAFLEKRPPRFGSPAREERS